MTHLCCLTAQSFIRRKKLRINWIKFQRRQLTNVLECQWFDVQIQHCDAYLTMQSINMSFERSEIDSSPVGHSESGSENGSINSKDR